MKDEYFVVKRGSTVIPNATVADQSISVAALGLLTWMLFMPPGAPLGYREFLGRGLGEKAVRNGLRELEVAGYRWRFQTRTPGGTLRTATLVFEQPVETEDARASAETLSTNRVEGCLSATKPGQQKALSNRADTGAARFDKRERVEVPEPAEDESPSGTVTRSTAARCTAARSTAPRSTAAQPSKDGYKEPKGSPPDQTEPVREHSASLVWPGLDGLLEHHGDELVDEDWELLVECLPPNMRMVEPDAMAKVAGALRKRLEAGWRPDALRATLAGNALPTGTEIRSLTGLVSYRIGQIPVRPPRRRRSPRRPDPVEPTEELRGPAQRPLALRMREKARADGLPEARNSISWWIAKYPDEDSGTHLAEATA